LPIRFNRHCPMRTRRTGKGALATVPIIRSARVHGDRYELPTRSARSSRPRPCRLAHDPVRRGA
jgi:hypothetical protein